LIITLCGSSRFEPWYHMWHEALALAGHAVFALTSYPSQHQSNKNWYTPQEKALLDEAHLTKIKHSNRVLFLNPFAYLGQSSLREFDYAMTIHGPENIFFLESWGQGFGVLRSSSYSIEKQTAHALYGVPENYGSPINTSESIFGNLWSSEILGTSGPLRSSIVDRLSNAERMALRGPNVR